ncbi:MAG: ribonuclease HII [Verrucomicrobia bacterium]|nr:ribonuclease HII [Verrucomicrobiota bacterium]
MPPEWKAERAKAGGAISTGLDEAGRGALKKREQVYLRLTDGQTGVWAVGECSVEEINNLNILVASQVAMRRALEALPAAEGILLVDGLPAKHLGREHVAMVNGDGICPSIAAASVVAKFSRDRILFEFSKSYPVYGWDRNRGYGTAAHLRALEDHGPCPLHRRSFLPVGSPPLPGLEASSGGR